MEHTEPLFWPYDNPFEVLEFDKDFLCVSPKKDVRKMENKGFSGLRSAEINLSKSMSLQASRMSTQSRLVGKSEFNRIPKKSSTRSTIIPPNNRRIQKFKLLPAQSSQCNSSSRKSTLLNLQSKKQKLELLSKKTLMELEAGNILQFFVEDMTIEKLVGLNEFDGHEGVDADFDDDLCIIV
ncbi:hypothetical protein AXF42_Ash009486 [Apostasia shenzhenica]|uniref:Uncharacterized protein n=1 Tax=Apostasia shenzhenica TaxID=1088818 RepID=A0A2I0B904_9ASPA|nr:hypothetical protein AXF42_Ash009486 [Apostasia shenzhenica]